MTQTRINRVFAPIKKYFPSWISNPIRSVVTAFLTPVLYSYCTGHFLSSFKMAAVSRKGDPLPWYTYPSIDFLKYKDFTNKSILEFGSGQSTLWWAKRARFVHSIEGNYEWYEKIKNKSPNNVDIHYVSMKCKETCISQIQKILASIPGAKFDVIVIDGLFRYELIDVACKAMKENGIIICDNAEGYGFYDGFKKHGLNRVDFYVN